MSGEEVLIPLFGMIGLFGWIPVAIYYKSQIRLKELEVQLQQGRGVESRVESRTENRAEGKRLDTNTAQALEDLRREVRELRDTTTRFDMAFDASLTTMEQRLEKAEARAYGTPTHNVVATTNEDTGQVLRNGRG